MAENTVELRIPGARGTVEVTGTLGARFKVRQNGVVVKSIGGVRRIARRSGTDALVTQRGVLPGFQSLWLDDTKLFEGGADTPSAAKVTMFAPLALIPFSYVVGAILAVALIFFNIVTVKNSAFPALLRILLPVTNTAAGLLLVLVLRSAAAA